jgi:hypothetical protein
MKIISITQICIILNLAFDVIRFLLVTNRRVPASGVLRQKTIAH